jgi:hypothetical protein
MDAISYPSFLWCHHNEGTFAFPGLKAALALFVSQDNQGPPTKAQVFHYYKELKLMHGDRV